MDCSKNYTVCVTCDEEKKYQLVNKACKAMKGYGYDENKYRLLPCDKKGCTECSEKYTECTKCDDCSKGISNYMNGDTTKTTIFVISFVAISVDPTGTFFKCTKILQVVNKLFFINIKYEKNLHDFLYNTASMITYEPNDNKNRPQFVYNSYMYRGKLSKYRISLDTVGTMNYKILLYMIVVIMRCVSRGMIHYECHMNRYLIYACYYIDKIHIAVFNSVFIDTVWLVYRTIVHSKGMSYTCMNISVLYMIVMSIDIYFILSLSLYSEMWRFAYRYYKYMYTLEYDPSKIESKAVQTGENQNSREARKDQTVQQKGILIGIPMSRIRINKMSNLSGANNSSEQAGSASAKPPQVTQATKPKEIDYPKTLRNLSMNIPMINLLCNHLRCSDTVYSSTACRVSYIWLYIRIPIIQLSILSLQDCPTLSITIISLQEILKLGSSVYTYAKYKHLKNVTLALLECSQSIFILVFLLLLLMISYNSKQVYHTLGMYTIIAACCIEYLLFLAYICYTLYVNLRAKRYAKQNNLKFNSYSLIVYQTTPVLADIEQESRESLENIFLPRQHDEGSNSQPLGPNTNHTNHMVVQNKKRRIKL